MSLDPIAYVYEADIHCPGCTFERFGTGEYGYVAEDAIDREGNPVSVIAPWDEWIDPDPEAEDHQVLACGTCHRVIEEWRNDE